MLRVSKSYRHQALIHHHDHDDQGMICYKKNYAKVGPTILHAIKLLHRHNYWVEFAPISPR